MNSKTTPASVQVNTIVTCNSYLSTPTALSADCNTAHSRYTSIFNLRNTSKRQMNSRSALIILLYVTTSREFIPCASPTDASQESSIVSYISHHISYSLHVQAHHEQQYEPFPSFTSLQNNREMTCYPAI